MSHQHEHAVYVISVAAELAGMHPQTLRIYERRGLLTPARTTGGNRRYSDADIARLLRITELASTGMNLEGIRHVMSLEDEVVRLRTEVERLRQGLMHAIAEIESRGRANIVPVRQNLSRFGERPSIFDPDR
jgi:MerR family transcriptional regulator/heat shock protein HspR